MRLPHPVNCGMKDAFAKWPLYLFIVPLLPHAFPDRKTHDFQASKSFHSHFEQYKVRRSTDINIDLKNCDMISRVSISKLGKDRQTSSFYLAA